MAAVSANVIHHQAGGHVSKMQQEQQRQQQNLQSDEDSNDSMAAVGDKHQDVSSPECKPASPGSPCVANSNPPYMVVSDYQQPEQVVPAAPVHHGLGSPESKSNTLQNSPFSMQNVLKMKQERDSVSPASTPCPNSGVFSTEKLLENTPSYVRQLSPRIEENQDNRNSYSPPSSRRESCSLDEDSPNKLSSDYQNRNRNDMDENSCCSEDTVLSVGNEAQMTSFDSENRTSSTANSQILSPRSSPTPSPASIQPNPVQNLSSFKHIQSHLSAISQLSQNLHTGQHMLLRPNPIAPNPLLFLNQNRLLFNPHHPLQPNVQVEPIHPNHQSLSNSPTSVIPAMSRLSPNEVSPNPASNQISPTSPGGENKLNLMQNLSNFAVLGQQTGLASNLRYYKHPFANPVTMQMGQHLPGLNSGFMLSGKSHELETNRKSNSRDRDKTANGNTNDRLFGSSNSSTTNHLSADEARHNLILNHNGLKFSIDNILKADFGRRITDPLHKRSKSGSTKSKFGPSPVQGAAPQKLAQPQVPLHHLKESAFSGAGVTKPSAFLPQSKDSNSYFKSNSNSNGSAPRLIPPQVEPPRLPELKVQSGSTTLQNNAVTSSVGGNSVGGNNGGASDKPAGGNPIDLSKQDQVAEEKALKGDGPMVWPAWVYCTRYSDRPSSGAFFFYYSF